MTKILRIRIIILLAVLFVGGSVLGYVIFHNKPSADTATTPIPEIAQVTALNAQIKTSLANRTKLPTTGVHNTTCKQLAQRAPLLASAISQVPDQAQPLFFDTATLNSIKPLNCPTDTVEQPNIQVSGSVQIIAFDLATPPTGPSNTNIYSVTATGNTKYSVVFSDYQQPAKALPTSGQTLTATGTLIGKTLLANTATPTVAEASTLDSIFSIPVAKAQTQTQTPPATRPSYNHPLGVHKTLVVYFGYRDMSDAYASSNRLLMGDSGMKSAMTANQTYWDQATWSKIHFQGADSSSPADFQFKTLGDAPFFSPTCLSNAVPIFDWISQQTRSVGPNYDNIVAISNAPFCLGYQGVSQLGSESGPAMSIINWTTVPQWTGFSDVISHELGHALGLMHGSSYTYSCSSPGATDIKCSNQQDEYGDIYNVMGMADTHLLGINAGWPRRDIPAIDKLMLGVMPTSSSGAGTITSANSPMTVNLYSNEANPASMPAGSFQNYELSSANFDTEANAYPDTKVALEYRPDLGSGMPGVQVHIDKRFPAQILGQPGAPALEYKEHTYSLSGSSVLLGYGQSYTISGVKIEFLTNNAKGGPLATVRISVPPSCPSGTELPWLSVLPVTPTANLSPGDTILFKLTVTGCTSHTMGFYAFGPGDDYGLITWPSFDGTTQANKRRLGEMLFSATGATNTATGLPNGLNIITEHQSAIPPIQANQPVTYYVYYTINPRAPTRTQTGGTVSFQLNSNEMMLTGLPASYELPSLKPVPAAQVNLTASNINVNPDPAGPVPFTDAKTSTPATYTVTYNATNVTNGATATAAVYLPSGNGWTVTSNTQMVTFSAAQKTFTDTIKIVPPTDLGSGIYHIPLLVRGYANGTTTSTVINLIYNNLRIELSPKNPPSKGPFLGSSIPLIK